MTVPGDRHRAAMPRTARAAGSSRPSPAGCRPRTRLRASSRHHHRHCPSISSSPRALPATNQRARASTPPPTRPKRDAQSHPCSVEERLPAERLRQQHREQRGIARRRDETARGAADRRAERRRSATQRQRQQLHRVEADEVRHAKVAVLAAPAGDRHARLRRPGAPTVWAPATVMPRGPRRRELRRRRARSSARRSPGRAR